MNKQLQSLIFILIFNIPIYAWADNNLSIKNAYHHLEEIYFSMEYSTANKNKFAEKIYSQKLKASLTNIELGKLDTEALEDLFQSIKLINFYNNKIKYTEDMQKLLQYLTQNDSTKKHHYIALQEAYIATRQFEAAKNMLEEQKIDYLQTIPKINTAKNLSSSEPTIWEIKGESLSQRAFNIPQKGPFILVVSHPLCGFSNSVSKYINRHKPLNNIFSTYSIWLSPPEGSLNLEHFQRWSQTYPKFSMGLMDKTPPQAGLGFSQTPIFYFFLDGKITSSLTGWPHDGAHAASLKIALIDIGLQPY
ncbi:MAG: hypothetical protein K0U59_08510 [Gammaproteobacteria bacterium]|nr:hypothetical protein [Gammaproteobacteria bacterium]